VRTVPMPVWVKDAVDLWRESAKVTAGRILRAVSRHGPPGVRGSLRTSSGTSSEGALSGCSSTISHHTISAARAPSSATSNGGELEQIQFLLGQVSVLTTERYLGCKQNLEEPVNDRFGCLFTRKSASLR
jgi:hypothetical protein